MANRMRIAPPSPAVDEHFDVDVITDVEVIAIEEVEPRRMRFNLAPAPLQLPELLPPAVEPLDLDEQASYYRTAFMHCEWCASPALLKGGILCKSCERARVWEILDRR